MEKLIQTYCKRKNEVSEEAENERFEVCRDPVMQKDGRRMEFWEQVKEEERERPQLASQRLL